MEDNKIIDLYFARSEDAISETDAKYGASCRRLSENIVGDSRDASECVNDTYLAAWNAIPPSRPDPFSSYLFKITRNLSLKKYRYNTAEKRNAHYDSSLSELEECLGEESAEDGAESNLTASVIDRFLGTLSRENRVIFVRRYWFADSCTEIGSRVGMSEKTVSMRLVRLRKKLRAHLSKEGINV